MQDPVRIGFVSTRLKGTDGVSLEVSKWAGFLESRGFECFYFAGESGFPPEKSFVVPEAHFEHPDIAEITSSCFGVQARSSSATKKIHELREFLKDKLYEFVAKYRLSLLILENCLSIPLNIPLGLAVSELIAETNIPSIAHHHDFYWERDRFSINAVGDILGSAFPPDLPSLRHVTINSIASRQLGYRKGISNIVIPNLFDFSKKPPFPDEYALSLKQEIGLSPDDPLILQPTRIVPRKNVERSIDIVRQLNLRNPVLVITHSASDEGSSYHEMIKAYASSMNVRLVWLFDRIFPERTTLSDGRKAFTLEDVYLASDLVTYPSSYEGFGNAFLEAVYYMKPVMVNRYSIYISDIEPKGFDVVAINNFASLQSVERIRKVLSDAELRRSMVEKNFSIAKRHYSLPVLEESLIPIIYELLALSGGE